LWRLIDLREADAYTQMAMDEAILRARSEGRAPNTIRLYRWRPSAVSIGYFQSLEEEVDLEACQRMGVDVVRRLTGGGAVYHDHDGEITYSLIAPETDPKVPRDIPESYRVICGCLVRALGHLGLKAEFRPINDILVGGRKVSGNAQTRRLGVVLQHGTVLIECDVRKMFTVLKVSEEKIRDKLIRTAEERVTSIRRELGRQVSFGEVREALIKGFEEGLDIRLEPGEPSDYEMELVEVLRERYRSGEWLRRR
jgi:lipoate-protein ligase A